MQNIMKRMEFCAMLLYQNREQEAYNELKELLGILNQILQNVAKEDAQKTLGLLNVFKELVAAYQMNDNLALADLLCVCVPNELEKIC